MTEIQDEKRAVGVEKPHLLDGCTEFTEIFYQLFLRGDPRVSAGLKMPQELKEELGSPSQGEIVAMGKS